MSTLIEEPKKETHLDNFGFIDFNIYIADQKDLDYNIPIDGWTFNHWNNFLSKVYEHIYGIPLLNYSKKSFNIIFADLVANAKDNYGMTNEEIRNFINSTVVNYLVAVKEYGRSLNLNNLKFKLPDFYSQYILPVIDKERYLGYNLRGVVLDHDSLKNGIQLNLEHNLDHLIRQLGIPIMVYYFLKVCEYDIKKSKYLVYSKIKERLEFEIKKLGRYTYMEQIVYNSIYFGPYSFESKLISLGFGNWREDLAVALKSMGIKEKQWYMESYPNRTNLQCVNKIFRKPRVSKG